MKKFILTISAICALLPLAANARLVNVYTEHNPLQDDWVLEGPAHELGWGMFSGGPFPVSQEISSVLLGPDEYIPCPVDYRGGINYRIQMMNQTGQDWTGVYYVADLETQLTNVDEWVGETGVPPGLAFKIDAVGNNTPLVFESIIADGIFQAGEVWEFVIQDYANALGGGPEVYDSMGIAGASTGFPPSTGSIIAVPEPATAMLLFVSAGVIAVFRRIRKIYGQ